MLNQGFYMIEKRAVRAKGPFTTGPLVIGLAHFVVALVNIRLTGWSVGMATVWAANALVLAALLLDFGVIADQTLGRRAVNLLRPEARGRVNGVYTGVFFIGGGIASAAAGVAWTLGGWNLVCALGAAFAAAALGLSLATLRDARLG